MVGSSIFFVDGCSAVRCNFGVFMRGGEFTSFYSAILSLPLNLVFLCVLSLIRQLRFLKCPICTCFSCYIEMMLLTEIFV